MSARAIAAVVVATLAGCHSSLPGGALAGRVVVDGGSAAGLVVTAVGPDSVHATTDGNGDYHFDGLPFAVYTVSATVHDTVEGTRSVSIASNGPVTLPDLRFTAAGELRGRATRGGGATGNAGILVTVEGTSALGVTSDDGGYHITLVPVGTYDLAAQVAGFRAAGVTGQVVRWGKVTDVPDIALTIAPGHATLHGQARLYARTDHGGTTVTINGTGLSTTTASDGTWTIDNVPEGSYSLHFGNGAYDETMPQVEALVGSDGLVIDDSLYELSRSPLTIYAGLRIAHTNASDGNFVISPDGTHVLYGDVIMLDVLQSAALDGKHVVTLVSDWNGKIDPKYSPALFSPDGTRTAFGEYNLLEVEATAGGTPTPLAYGVLDLWWSPTGAGLAYSAPDPTSGVQTLSYSTVGGTPLALVTDANLRAPAWSHDGKSLLYQTDVQPYYGLGTIKRVALDGSGPVAIVGSAPPPLVRADHRWAIISGNTNTNVRACDLVTVNLDAGTVTTVAAGVASYPAPQFAGDRVVYETGGSLWAAPLDGSSKPVALATGLPSDGARGYTVSSDASRIAYTAGCSANGNEPCQLWTVASDGSAMPEKAADAVTRYELSRDGSHVWFYGVVQPQGMVTLSIEAIGQAPRIISSSAADDYVTTRFLPDGSGVLFVDATGGQNAVAIFRLGDGSLVSLGNGASPPLYAVDGQHVVFSLPAPGNAPNLWIAPVDGSTSPRTIIDGSAAAWSPSGALVAYRGGTPAPYRFQNGLYVFQP